MSSAAQQLPDEPVPSVAAVPGPPRQRDAERTRAEILDVATREFAEQGYAGARVDEIAAKTRTTKRMIYYYFGGKEQLYVTALERAYARIRGREKELDLEHLDPVQAIRALAELTFDHHEANPDFLRLVSIENMHYARHIARSETLSNLADVLRKRAQMKLKIRAMSSESKASAYIIGSLPFVVFTLIYYINPSYMGDFFTDQRLIIAGVGGVVWMSIGAFIMSKMIAFEI